MFVTLSCAMGFVLGLLFMVVYPWRVDGAKWRDCCRTSYLSQGAIGLTAMAVVVWWDQPYTLSNGLGFGEE